MHMERHRRLRLRRLPQHTGGQHGLRAGKALLIRLEHQTHRACQFLPVLLQKPCRPQQHSGMKVVAAGVHIPVFGAEVQRRFLPDSQGVHIRPQQDAPPGFLTGNLRRHAPCQHPGRIAQCFQPPLYIGRRLRQFRSGFRIPVQRPAIRKNLRLHDFRFL